VNIWLDNMGFCSQTCLERLIVRIENDLRSFRFCDLYDFFINNWIDPCRDTPAKNNILSILEPFDDVDHFHELEGLDQRPTKVERDLPVSCCLVNIHILSLIHISEPTRPY